MGCRAQSQGGPRMNLISREKLLKLELALGSGASLREAEAYAGVSHQTALRYRILLGLDPQPQNSWKKRWIPPEKRHAR